MGFPVHQGRREGRGPDLPGPPLPGLRPARGAWRSAATPEIRLRKPEEDGGGTAFADLRLEARRPDRNEEARRGPEEALPPGLRLLDAPRARPAPLRRPVQLRRVLGLRLRDPDGHARGPARPSPSCPSATARWPSSFPRTRSPSSATTTRRSRARPPTGWPGASTSSSSARCDRERRPSASSSRCSWPSSPRTSACWSSYLVTRLLEECTEPARQLRPAGRPLRRDEHAGQDAGRALQGRGLLQRRPVRPSGAHRTHGRRGGPSHARPPRPIGPRSGPRSSARSSSTRWAREERHAFGAHFTNPADIMKIVGPTIVEPWRELIENATTLKRLGELLQPHAALHRAGPGLRLAATSSTSPTGRSSGWRPALLERTAELSKKGMPAQRQLGLRDRAPNFYGMDINALRRGAGQGHHDDRPQARHRRAAHHRARPCRWTIWTRTSSRRTR